MQGKNNRYCSSHVSTHVQCAVKAKSLKRVLGLLLVLAMLVAMAPQSLLSGTSITADAGEGNVTLQNPQIVKDTSMKAYQKATYDCIYFGSYPQTEIVDKDATSGCYGKKWASSSDYIADEELYGKLKNAVYDANGDTTLDDGTKYRRIKKSDATNSAGLDKYIYKWSDATSYHYFKYEPIKWRVLNVNEGKALLLADKALDDQQYNRSNTSGVTWETSTIRSWLNGYGSTSNSYGTDYSNKNFINSAFTSDEQNAIEATSTVNNDKIFFLSSSDLYKDKDTAKSYGFTSASTTYDEARRCFSSTYAKAMGAYSSDTYLGKCPWWLQTLGTYSTSAVYVNNSGTVEYTGNKFDNKTKCCRPALTLNLSSSNLYTYAGTVCSDGSVNCNNHSFGEAQYIWSNDGTSCTAKMSCENADCTYELSEAGKVTRTETTAATCTEKGSAGCTATFEDTRFRQQETTVEIEPKGHDYDYNYEWSNDGSMCVAIATCKNDPAHVVTVKGAITHEEKTSATCTAKGITTYTATFTNSNGTNFVQQTKDVSDITAAGHIFGEWTVTTPATCEAAGEETRTCTNNGCSEKETRKIDALGHNYGTPTYDFAADGKSCTAKTVCENDPTHVINETGIIISKVKTAPTCTVNGTTTYTAIFTNNAGTSFVQQTKDVQDIASIGHIYGEPQYIWSEDGKSCTAEVSCTKEGCTGKISENGTITSEVTSTATRVKKGTTTYTAKFENNIFSDQTKSIQDIPKVYDGGSSSEGSATSTDTYNITIPKTIANGSIASSLEKAEKYDIVSLTVKADDGYKLGGLTVKNEEGRSVEIKTVAEGSKYSFVMPASDVIVEVTFEAADQESVPDEDSNPFVDVTKGDYFYDAVQWAFGSKIAAGTDASHFNPDGITNRAQAAAFLWRAAGEKTVDYELPFTDIEAGSYYENAVRWACSENITKGLTDTTFGPLSEVSRAQMVTFLWRMAGSPKAESDAAGGNKNAGDGQNQNFSDVSSDAYYYDAVNWAVSNGITTGTSDAAFSPDDKCTRAQVVTFIYRYKK